MILALAGGVGGAKLANGLASILLPNDLVVIVNTGDDFSHLGLRISPDIDTVMYTLAGRSNSEAGWGLAGDTWHFMEALERLSGENWFRLGDRDLATHVERTRRLKDGQTLSEVTAELCKSFGVAHQIAPMTDHTVQTILRTNEGTLSFQHYFVRRRCEPTVLTIDFISDRQAAPSPAFAATLSSGELHTIIICPSNPYLSIHPILSLSHVRNALLNRSVPVVAVSPIIGGTAVKGPAAKIMRDFGRTPSVVEIAHFYTGLIDGLVIDERDGHLRSEIEAMGIRVCVTNALMKTVADQAFLAKVTSDFASGINLQSRSQPVR